MTNTIHRKIKDCNECFVSLKINMEYEIADI